MIDSEMFEFVDEKVGKLPTEKNGRVNLRLECEIVQFERRCQIICLRSSICTTFSILLPASLRNSFLLLALGFGLLLGDARAGFFVSRLSLLGKKEHGNRCKANWEL